MNGEVIRLPVRRRLHIARPRTLHETLGGIVSDTEELMGARFIDPDDLRSIGRRFMVLADRLECDSRPGPHRET
ncbi:hypothetical protein [Azospirillum sp. B506]|uniref:hypothetical protein n=1 Tax=Azospirillum sp. B506 TaxID=137721 RepID=UPI0005B2BC3C|nr:hypothetical protein [Azospirillum sp. B506]